LPDGAPLSFRFELCKRRAGMADMKYETMIGDKKYIVDVFVAYADTAEIVEDIENQKRVEKYLIPGVNKVFGKFEGVKSFSRTYSLAQKIGSIHLAGMRRGMTFWGRGTMLNVDMFMTIEVQQQTSFLWFWTRWKKIDEYTIQIRPDGGGAWAISQFAFEAAGEILEHEIPSN